MIRLYVRSSLQNYFFLEALPILLPKQLGPGGFHQLCGTQAVAAGLDSLKAVVVAAARPCSAGPCSQDPACRDSLSGVGVVPGPPPGGLCYRQPVNPDSQVRKQTQRRQSHAQNHTGSPS